jgi:N-acetylglucosamine kinase-like BadF-type ATPase
MAGGITSPQLPRFTAMLHSLGVPAAPVIEGDLLGGFFSATWQDHGYGLFSGTGSGAIRVAHGEMVEVADGLGWLTGDAGSGFWIGHQVARAAFADLDRRGPATALTSLVRSDLGVAAGLPDELGRSGVLPQLVRSIYDLRPVELARFARFAFDVGDDPVAAGILDGAAHRLAHSLRVVLDPALPGPLALGGSVLAEHPDFARRVVELLADLRPVITGDAIPVADGSVGAVILALRRTGVVIGAELHATVRATLAALTVAWDA